MTWASQPCQEIPVEQMSGGALARMRLGLSIGAGPGPPGGSVRVAAAREPGTLAAGAAMTGWLVMTGGTGCWGGWS